MSEAKQELTEQQRGEMIMLGEKLASVYGKKVKFYQQLYKLHPEDSYIQENYAPDKLHAAASEPISDARLEQLSETPLKDICWSDLNDLVNRDRAKAIDLWERIKSAAIDDLASGQFACDVVEDYSSKPWVRAQFIAVRGKFIEAWQPRDCIEAGMIEMLAQAFYSFHFWLSRANSMAAREYDAVTKDEGDLYTSSKWKSPRLEVAEAIERALAIADRFNRLFMRTLRQMRDLRRYSVPVTINNPQQVNIAADGGQQVNVQKSKKRAKDKQQGASAAPGSRRLRGAK